MHQCQARENMQPVKSARKYATKVKGREHATSANKGKMYPVRRTGKHATGSKRRKQVTSTRCRKKNSARRGKTCNQCPTG